MTNFLQLITLLAIILIAAKLAGYLSTRLGQPSVFGELLMGVLLGPSLLDLTHLPMITNTHLPETITEIGEIGVLLLMFLAGLELHVNDLARSARVAAFSGVLGVLFPVGMGLIFGELTGMDFNHSLFLGLTLGATSVSISAQVLIELKKIRSKVGLGLLGAAIFDDILVILLLSIFMAVLSNSSGSAGILLVIVKMLVFFALSTAFGLWVLPVLVRTIHKKSISQGVTTLALVIMLVYALAAEVVGGMAAITGAFLGGLMFARTPEKDAIESNLHSIAYAFFVPIFFISIGLSVNLRGMNANTLWITLGITVIAVLGKVIGAGSGALMSKFSARESLQIGVGMVSRGEVGLIIAKIGLGANYLSPELFGAIIAMILVTTVVTPPLLRISFAETKKSPEPVAVETGSDPKES